MEDMEYTGSRRVDRIWAGGVAEEQGYSIEHSHGGKNAQSIH